MEFDLVLDDWAIQVGHITQLSASSNEIFTIATITTITMPIPRRLPSTLLQALASQRPFSSSCIRYASTSTSPSTFNGTVLPTRTLLTSRASFSLTWAVHLPSPKFTISYPDYLRTEI